MSEPRARRWWRRFREAISVAADLWDAVKLAALFAAFVVAAVVGTAVFALDVMPTALLVLLVVGIAGLAFVLLQPLARRLLPVQPDPPTPPPARAVGVPDPYAGARALERDHRDAARRKALRLIREELLDNKHALDLYLLDHDMNAISRLQFDSWNGQREALLSFHDPAPHERASEAYRRLWVFHGLLYKPSSIDNRVYERDPNPEHPIDADVKEAISAIHDAAGALASAEDARKPPA